MQFRRIDSLPPYVFAQVNELKAARQAEGRDVVDLGFGNPDIASPPAVVEALVEAARSSSNHGYSASRGIAGLRRAVADRYERRFGVTLDPETQVINTIGAKEGLAHLMWALVGPGDVALVPEPSYPIHIYAPAMAGAEVRRVALTIDADFFSRLELAFAESWPRPRVILVSFPHNPTTASVDHRFFERLVAFAKANDVMLVHDFAYADIVFDDRPPPSLLQVPGALDVGVELYTLSKGHSMAGWRVGFVVGNAEMVGALAKLKSYLDYGTFQPIQIAAIAALDAEDGYPEIVSAEYQGRRDVLVEGLNQAGWKVEKPAGTMFVWAEIPGPYQEGGSLAFSMDLLQRADVAVSPGIGFGPSGDGHVRFALVEPEDRLLQAVDAIATALDRL